MPGYQFYHWQWIWFVYWTFLTFKWIGWKGNKEATEVDLDSEHEDSDVDIDEQGK